MDSVETVIGLYGLTPTEILKVRTMEELLNALQDDPAIVILGLRASTPKMLLTAEKLLAVSQNARILTYATTPLGGHALPHRTYWTMKATLDYLPLLAEIMGSAVASDEATP